MKTQYKVLLSTLTALNLSFSLPAFAAYDPGYVPDWSYQGANGPTYWGELNPIYAACVNTHQSPISLPENPKALSSLPINIHYQPGIFNEYLDNHNLYVFQNDRSSAETITVNGKSYRLSEIHFHTPAEHQLGSKTFPLEAHLVHKDAQGHVLAVGVWIVPGAPNPFITKLLNTSLPKMFVQKTTLVTSDPSTILPSNRSFYNYQGSLTTPPCGDVAWIMIHDTVTASPKQIEALKKLLKNNARPIQKLNSRSINWVNVPLA